MPLGAEQSGVIKIALQALCAAGMDRLAFTAFAS